MGNKNFFLFGLIFTFYAKENMANYLFVGSQGQKADERSPNRKTNAF